MAKKYWAASDTEECVNEAWTRMEKFYSVMRASRLLDLYRNAYWNRYTGGRSGGNIGISGENGELTNIELGTYGNLIQHMLTLIIGQRPSFDAKASNSDYASMAQAILANSGCANACTGPEGLHATLSSTQAVAGELGIDPELVLPASTGVIGVEMDAVDAAGHRG